MPQIDWQKLYEAAMLEMNPDKLAACIGAAEQGLHRGGRAGHRATRITCGYYRTRTSQVGRRPFNAQEFEQNCFVARETGRM